MTDALELTILRMASRNSGKLNPARYELPSGREIRLTVDPVDPRKLSDGFRIRMEPTRYYWHAGRGQWVNTDDISEAERADPGYIIPKWRDDGTQVNSTIHQLLLAHTAAKTAPFDAVDTSQ